MQSRSKMRYWHCSWTGLKWTAPLPESSSVTSRLSKNPCRPTTAHSSSLSRRQSGPSLDSQRSVFVQGAVVVPGQKHYTAWFCFCLSLISPFFQEFGSHQAQVNDQSKQLEKESSVRLELENNIMSSMQHKLLHNNAAKYSQLLTEKISRLKKEKVTKSRKLFKMLRLS